MTDFGGRLCVSSGKLKMSLNQVTRGLYSFFCPLKLTPMSLRWDDAVLVAFPSPRNKASSQQQFWGRLNSF